MKTAPFGPRLVVTVLLTLTVAAPAVAGKPVKDDGGTTEPPPPPPVYYHLTWLGTLGGQSVANGINSAGQVVGFCHDGTTPRPYVYDPALGMYDLNAASGAADFGWQLVTANDINDAGQIVGKGTYDGQTRGYRYTPPATDPETGATTPAAIENLGLVDPAHDQSTAGSINGWGDAAGLSRATDGSWYAFLNTAETGTIGFLPTGYKAMTANPPAVNLFGQVVGQFNDGTKTWAYRYSPAAANPWEEFGPLAKPRKGYGSSMANDINDYSEFCGRATVSDGSIRAFRYTDGAGMKDLGAGSGSAAFGINSPTAAGGTTVVGYLGSTTKNGSSYTPGFVHRDDWGVLNLDRCVTGAQADLDIWNAATIVFPWRVNDAGQICGKVRSPDDRAFLLTPIEP